MFQFRYFYGTSFKSENNLRKSAKISKSSSKYLKSVANKRYTVTNFKKRDPGVDKSKLFKVAFFADQIYKIIRLI